MACDHLAGISHDTVIAVHVRSVPQREPTMSDLNALASMRQEHLLTLRATIEEVKKEAKTTTPRERSDAHWTLSNLCCALRRSV